MGNVSAYFGFARDTENFIERVADFHAFITHVRDVNSTVFACDFGEFDDLFCF
ncbi:hypothetical protein D3C83_282060 [compost metagenome]